MTGPSFEIISTDKAAQGILYIEHLEWACGGFFLTVSHVQYVILESASRQMKCLPRWSPRLNVPVGSSAD